MKRKLFPALLLALALTGCEMEKVPGKTPEQIENERYESILDKFRVEPTDEPVSTCLDVRIDNLAYDSSEWTLELPKINSSKPVAEKINKPIFTKYTERVRDEIEELTETRKTESQHRTRYFSSESDGFVYIEINVLSGADNSAETETIYYDSTNDNELGMFEFFDALVGDMAITGTPKFIMRSASRQTLKGISKDSGSGRYICEGNMIDGAAVEIDGQIGADDIFYGDFSNILVGTWGGLEVMLDPYRWARSGQVEIIANLIADVAIRNPKTFVKRVKS